jgi:hypothetical protein
MSAWREIEHRTKNKASDRGEPAAIRDPFPITYSLLPTPCFYWSSVNCARRFCCQHASFCSVQNCFSLP